MTNNKQQTEMNKEFAPYELALELKQLGFDEPCLGYYLASSLFISNDNVYNSTDIPVIKAPLYSQAFRFFREKYDLHVQIRKENYFQERKYEYYHFDISKGEENDITKQEDLLYKILDECSQDIPGNHLDHDMYSKLIIEKEFAFKTYEESELGCLRHLIKIVKENENQI
jgi:hypothetical protein